MPNFNTLLDKLKICLQLRFEFRDAYLNKIKKSIAFCVNHFKPDFVLYDAGIDIHKLDELGKLNIDDDGCLERDLIVLSYLKNLSIPVATVIGGGYSKDKKDLAKRHSIIFKAANHVFI